MTKFKQKALEIFKSGAPIDEFLHPEILAEIKAIQEEEAKKKSRIKEVVKSTADISAELAGRIIVRVTFKGSLAKIKKLTPEEKRLVMNLPADVKAKMGADKTLFYSKEYDDLVSWIAKCRIEFASFGIPNMFDGETVVDITRIPEIEELAERTEKEMQVMVEKLIAVYPSQITEEATQLGQLHNPRDYKPVETLTNLFKLKIAWMGFGAPDQLKQFDLKLFKKYQAKALESWREIEANGVLLLRQTVSDLVGGLVESLTPIQEGERAGEKKKFYASSVTKITDFIETFKRRNICGDEELDSEVEKLKQLVTGIDLKSMSTDLALREKVKKDMTQAKSGLDKLTVSAKARAITLID